MNVPRLTRRDFTAGVGGIVLSFSMGPQIALAQGKDKGKKPRLPGSLNNNRMLNAWLRIDADGTATVFTGKVELGQGILTSLSQIAAEELDLPFNRVKIISGDTNTIPNEGKTNGSFSIENSGTAIRLATAEARAILLELAAQRLGTPADKLRVTDGIIATPDGKTVGYGELAASVDLKREATAKVKPKPPAQHKIVGQSIQRVDIPAKVTGGAVYVQDVRVPGMVHGRVVRPPRYMAKLESVDESRARAIPGVIAVVHDGSFLGVVAEREENAIKARLALAAGAKWSGGSELPEQSKLFDLMMTKMPSVESVTSEKKAMALAGAKVVEATYTRPFQAHASIGPSCSVAEFKDGKYIIWTHTQGVFPLRNDIAKVLKVNRNSIRCIFAEGSGCYGRSGADDVTLDAALLARAVPGRAVRVQWMRDDEFVWEPYGSAMAMRARGAVHEGRVVDWQYEVWSGPHGLASDKPEGSFLFPSWYLGDPQPRALARNANNQGDRNATPLYEFPSQRVRRHFISELPLFTASLRTLGAYSNVFAVESFVDELAAAAGVDPLTFRLAHMKDPRARAVIEAAAKLAGWKVGEKGDGSRGRGIGFNQYKGSMSYCACVAEVQVDRKTGKVRVPHVYAAVDAGQVINPDGLVNQVEGGIIQSASWTLMEEVRFDRGTVTQRDFNAYPILTMDEAPKVDVQIINRPNERSLGAGETSQGPAGAAIANAFAAATGKRIRDLPFHPQRVKAILG
ncbi:MAG: molybdopterin cofactor-binding domain-containing protein [Xanthobacteraceae bacterium]